MEETFLVSANTDGTIGILRRNIEWKDEAENAWLIFRSDLFYPSCIDIFFMHSSSYYGGEKRSINIEEKESEFALPQIRFLSLVQIRDVVDIQGQQLD